MFTNTFHSNVFSIALLSCFMFNLSSRDKQNICDCKWGTNARPVFSSDTSLSITSSGRINKAKADKSATVSSGQLLNAHSDHEHIVFV